MGFTGRWRSWRELKTNFLHHSYWFHNAERCSTRMTMEVAVHMYPFLISHNVFYKSFIIYASISILLVLHELLHLVLPQLLTCGLWGGNCQLSFLTTEAAAVLKYLFEVNLQDLPSVARTCLSSAPMTVPFPSLSKTLRPSTKSSKVPRSLALQMCWCMGRNWSKSSILLCMSVENNKTNINNDHNKKKKWKGLIFELYLNLSLCLTEQMLYLNLIQQSISTNLIVHMQGKSPTVNTTNLQLWAFQGHTWSLRWWGFGPEPWSSHHTGRKWFSSRWSGFCQTAGRHLWNLLTKTKGPLNSAQFNKNLWGDALKCTLGGKITIYNGMP